MATPSDFQPGPWPPWVEEKPQPSADAGDEAGLNMVLLIQVPLKQTAPQRRAWYFGDGLAVPEAVPMAFERSSDVEDAVIGHGKAGAARLQGPGRRADRARLCRRRLSGTAQEVALELVARKVSASLQVDGLDIQAALEAAGAGSEVGVGMASAMALGEAVYRELVREAG